MEANTSVDLLTRATLAYQRVDADPVREAAYAAAVTGEARRGGVPEALVLALRAQAWSDRGRLDNKRAIRLLNEAARLARRHDLPQRLGEILVTRAAVNVELGRLTRAQGDLDSAEQLVHGQVRRQRNLQQAILHHNAGRLGKAILTYRRLLSDVDTPLDIRGKVANNLSLAEAQRGAFDTALRCLDEAATIAAAVSPALAASVTQSRGWVLVQAGRLPEGLRLYDDAARLYKAAGLPLGEHFIEYAEVLADLRLLPEAHAAAQRAVQEFDGAGVPLMAAQAELRTAQLAVLSGSHGVAEAAWRARETFRRQGRPSWAAQATMAAVEARLESAPLPTMDLQSVRAAARTLDRLGARAQAVHAHLVAGRLAARTGRPARSLESLARAQSLARGAPVLVRLDGRVAAALAAQLSGRDQDVLRQCRAGLRDLARHRMALPSMELRALASGHGVELGRLGLEVSLRTGSPGLVLDWLERTRAAALSSVEPPATDGLEDEMGQLRAVHADLAEAQTSGSDQSGLLSRQRAIESQLRRASWVRRETSSGVSADGEERTSTAAIRGSLGGRVLVEYGVHAGALFAVVLESRRSRLVHLGPVQAVETQTQGLLFALRRLAHPRSPASQAAARASADAGLQRLTALLLAPLRLSGQASLVVVPLRDLHRLPWSALHHGPVALAPSASFWRRTSAAPADAAGPTVLVAGPDLPGAAQEIEAVRQLYAAPVVLVPPDSTAATVARAVTGADLAHLACHGDLRADNPTFSALRMSDGPLTLHELERRGAAPRRILLASCESGAQVSYAGDEVVGFVSALMARGTAGLVASTVVVSDGATVSLMCEVHQQLRRKSTLADALHTARTTVDRADPRSFAAWCAFNAYGAA